jgi:hypothetical protein
MEQFIIKREKTMDIPLTLSCDNQGVIKGCRNKHSGNLHWKASMDLHIEALQVTNVWVKGHQDATQKWEATEELIKLELPTEATLNVLCDKMASNKMPDTHVDDPVYPHEQWVVRTKYPISRKATGRLDQMVRSSIHKTYMATYIQRKHGLDEAWLDGIEDQHLQQ